MFVDFRARKFTLTLMKKILTAVLLFIAMISFGQVLSEPIELLNVADGKMVSLTPCANCKGAVVIFTSLACPYDQHYRDRIKSLIEKHAGSVSFFLINSNPGPDEDEGMMKTAYTAWGISIPLLSDKDQLAMNALGVKRTPESVLLKPNGKGLTIIYQGAIDDNPQVHHDTGNNFLDEAIGALISNQSPKVASERVIGCTIKKP
jgi:hypothetical protein